VSHVIAEEKHMGSRGVVVLCRDQTVAPRRFGMAGSGSIVTRTGRRFFDDEWRDIVLRRLSKAATTAGLWDELATDVLVLDAEILPWSLKAEELIRSQYASVGVAAARAADARIEIAEAARARGVEVAALGERWAALRRDAVAFVTAYRRYAPRFETVDDVRIAPFQILAGSSSTYVDRDHAWHMGLAERLAEAGPAIVVPTRHRVVDVTDPDSQASAEAWWEELTESGGEGIVVKPMNPVVRGRRGLIQPGIKVRGREYLRIIYGPTYTEPENLQRLRQRGLGRKRSLAAREFALGVEALERWTRGEPLHRVHECVFAVLALESEPVDPRL